MVPKKDRFIILESSASSKSIAVTPYPRGRRHSTALTRSSLGALDYGFTYEKMYSVMSLLEGSFDIRALTIEMSVSPPVCSDSSKQLSTT